MSIAINAMSSVDSIVRQLLFNQLRRGFRVMASHGDSLQWYTYMVTVMFASFLREPRYKRQANSTVPSKAAYYCMHIVAANASLKPLCLRHKILFELMTT